MLAVHRGARLLVGRCSQDDGAPPLWPWQQVLRGLGADLDVGDERGRGCRVPHLGGRSWARSPQAAADETLVVVLDDLHWADVPTLRVLRLLIETVETGRLLVLSAPGAPTPSPPVRWPTPPSRWPGGTPSGSSSPASTAAEAADRGGGGRRGRAERRAGRPAGLPHRRQPVLPGRVRPAGPRRRRPVRADDRGRSADRGRPTCWPAGSSGCPRRAGRCCAGRA